MVEITQTADGAAPLSISELSKQLQRHVQSQFDGITVEGEVAEVKRPSSGHVYFTLKDEDATLNAIIWRGVANKLSILPEIGGSYVASGHITTYPARSNYQLIVSTLKPTGEGALLKLLEERKRKLAAEGLFSADKKQQIPRFPQRIGVISSPSGAVIRDIMHRLNDRYPSRVLLWPAAMQGVNATTEVQTALTGFNNLPTALLPDVIIIARGGGSIEDLMPFNDEALVRAVAASRLPVISAVGHETDTTLCDLAADLRAPTPSAAAELAVPVWREVLAFVRDRGQRMERITQRRLERSHLRLQSATRGIADPRRVLDGLTMRLDEQAQRLERVMKDRLMMAQKLELLSQRLTTTMKQTLQQVQHRLATTAALLSGHSSETILRRGYALLRDEAGQIITAGQAAPARFTINRARESFAVQRLDKPAKAKRPTKSQTPDLKQGRLF